MGVNPSLNSNNINWNSDILVKCFMLFIENFLQLSIILITLLHRYRTLLELKGVKSMICMEIIIPIQEP